MKSQFVVQAVAAALVLWGTSAGASTAQATLSNFHIDLIDLDPGDGIAPSVVFQNYQGGTFVAAEAGSTDAHGQQTQTTDIESGAHPFGNAAAFSSQGSAMAFAAIAGNPLEGGANVSTFTSSSQVGAFGGSTVMLGDGGNYVSFTLSADTRLVISGDASASVMSTADDLASDVFASVFLQLTDFTGQGQISYGSASAEQGSTNGASPFTLNDDRHLEVSFENLGSDSADGIFFGSVDTSVSDPAPPPVPEPTGSVLMAAALGLLGLIGRRATRSSRV
jgi:hypothetical protein